MSDEAGPKGRRRGVCRPQAPTDLATDPETLDRLAREGEDENWRFRCFLKAVDLNSAEVDANVRQVYREVSRRIDCRS